MVKPIELSDNRFEEKVSESIDKIIDDELKDADAHFVGKQVMVSLLGRNLLFDLDALAKDWIDYYDPDEPEEQTELIQALESCLTKIRQ